MSYSEEIYRKLKTCGALNFSLDETINHLYGMADLTQLAIDLRDETSLVFLMYQSGLNTGKYALAASEFQIRSAEAEKAQLELKREKLYHNKLLEIAGYDED